MNNKTITIAAFTLLLACSFAGAADYRLIYKSGKVDIKNGVITSGKNSSFVLSFGAAAEVRCGASSALIPGKISKTAESAFTLKTGTCFIRLIDDGAGASISLETPFAVLKTSGGAFYAGCSEKAVSVYDGSVRMEYAKRLLKLTAGRTFKDGKVTENQADADPWKDWNFKRDKNDIYVNLRVNRPGEEKTISSLTEAIGRGYGAGGVFFAAGNEPQELSASVTITADKEVLTASGVVFSDIYGTAGIISASKKAERTGDAFESQAFLPLIYDVSADILTSIEQMEANAVKNGRKVIIEAEGLSDTGCARVEKLVSGMPGFISINAKKYHNIKAVFEVVLYGTGYDIAGSLSKELEKNNINVWKYSKNIVKLRAVKVER